MPSLLDQFGPFSFDAALTAAALDGESGTVVAGDSAGGVAVWRGGESSPGLRLNLGPARVGAVAVLRGGVLVAAGDDDGTVAVFDAASGEEVFRETRELPQGRLRAMHGLSLSPEGARLAAVAADGLIRLWDIERNEREVAWQGFGGHSVEFDSRGTRILTLDTDGQPRLIDLASRQAVPMDRLQMTVDRAVFSRDGTQVIAAGAAGLAILRVVDGGIVNSVAARGGSGLVALLTSPDGTQVAAVSPRSVHVFSVPSLAPAGTWRHGAPEPGAAIWGPTGVRVGGVDGIFHDRDVDAAGPVRAVSGFGDRRIALHSDVIAAWRGDHRDAAWPIPAAVDVVMDRDGKTLALTTEDDALLVLNARTGESVLNAGRVERGTVSVGGSLVAAMRPGSGARYWDLANNRQQDIPGARGVAVSLGGTWVAIVNANGRVRVIDPVTGAPVVPDPSPPGDAPVRLIGFVNRRPDLLLVDAEAILTWYDLAASVRDGTAAVGRDVLQFSTAPDRVWGITGGRYAAVRLPEGDSCSLVFADLSGQSVVAEVSGLHPLAVVDPESGLILEPARGAAILERDMNGTERRVMRALPSGEWVCFGPLGILSASPGAAERLQ